MSDLQTLLEGITLEDLNVLSDKMEDEAIERNADTIWQIIINVYYEETGQLLNHQEMSEEAINKLFGDFKISVALYINVRTGKMTIVSGRIKLSDTDNCKYSLTERGIASAVKIIKG